MASSRRSPPADAAAAVGDAAASVLAALAGRRVGIALSGGRDSSALLVACAAHAAGHRVALAAVHVHHGLSAYADGWTDACEALTLRWGVPLAVRRVRVDAAAAFGVEAAARRERYAALRDAAREHALDAILLAHHEDDQAETVLLQALRGGGPHGLAAMPAWQRDDDGLVWARPFLHLPRATIDAFVAVQGIPFVDDDSNAVAHHRRNALRLDVMPAIARTFPGASRTLARVAAHQADAAALLDDLAAQDAGDGWRDGTLDCATLASLAAPRARNLLRWFLRRHGLPSPSTARLAAMLAQLAVPRADARTRLVHAGVALGVHRGRVHVHTLPPPSFAVPWQGEADVRLPHGRLAFVEAHGEGLSAASLAGRAITIASRGGGERLAIDVKRPRRALAAWLYDAGLPPWARDALPLVRCDDEVVAVAALGVAPAWQATGSAPGYRLEWHPDPPVPAFPR